MQTQSNLPSEPKLSHAVAELFIVQGSGDVAVMGIDVITALLVPSTFTMIIYCGDDAALMLRTLGVASSNLFQLGDTCGPDAITQSIETLKLPLTAHSITISTPCGIEAKSIHCNNRIVNITRAVVISLQRSYPDADINVRSVYHDQVKQGRFPACQLRRITQGLMYGLIPRLPAWGGDNSLYISDLLTNTSLVDSLFHILLLSHQRPHTPTVVIQWFQDDADIQSFNPSGINPDIHIDAILDMGCIACTTTTTTTAPSIPSQPIGVDYPYFNFASYKDTPGIPWYPLLFKILVLLDDTSTSILPIGTAAHVIASGISSSTIHIQCQSSTHSHVHYQPDPPVSIINDSMCDYVISSVSQQLCL